MSAQEIQVGSPPDQVDLVYRKVGVNHVFASKGIRGLVHVGHRDLAVAYHTVIEALNVHVTNTYGVPAKYVCETDIRDLAFKVASTSGNMFAVHLDHRQAA